jgi:hypothetical protein
MHAPIVGRLQAGGGEVHGSAMPCSYRDGSDPLPIWMAVLQATSCHASSNSRHHAVRWHHTSGRAVYTNAGHEDERIEPLGVSLTGGQTLAVSWMPGDTAYTLEVYGE